MERQILMVESFEDIIGKKSSTESFESIVGSDSANKANYSFTLPAPSGMESFEDIVKPSKVGFTEAFAQRPKEKIPFSPAKLVRTTKTIESAKRLQSFDYANTEEDIKRKYPNALPSARKRLLANANQLRSRDIKTVEDYLLEQGKEYTLGGKVGQITSEMPAFIIEFLATGGLSKVGKESAKKAGEKILGKYAATTAGRAAIGTGSFATSAAFRASGMPHRAAESILKRQAPKAIDIKDGEVTIVGPGELPYTSIWKGLADHYIEIASEQAGEYLSPSFSKLVSKTPFMGKFISKLKTKWLGIHGTKAAADFMKKIGTKSGFHGIVGEIGEEYLGDITRAIVNVDDFGADNIAQQTHRRNANPLERIAAAVKADTDNLPAMAISFAIPGIGAQAVSSISAKQVGKNEQLKDLLKQAQRVYELAPTQIETAEGVLGYEDDFLIEKIGAAEAKDFKKVGLTKIFTPKWLVNRMLGVETLLEDVDKAKLSLSLETENLNNWTKKIIKGLKKEKGLRRLAGLLPEEAEKEATIVSPGQIIETAEGTLGEEFIVTKDDIKKTPAHRLFQKLDSKNPIYVMRDLLDTYEDAPPFLTDSEAKIFNQVRELTRYLRDRANRVREKQGLPLINDVSGYIMHWMDAAAQRVVNKDVPVHSGYLYHLMKGIPKKITNPKAMHRKVHGYMEKYFSKDLGKLLRHMVAYDLRDIHLMQPYQAVWDELQRLRKEQAIPDSTFKAVEDYLMYDIRNYKTPLDKAFNYTLKKPVDLINALLPQKYVINDVSKTVSSMLRRMGHLSGLGFRLKPPIRNLGQRLLLLDLYRTKDYAKAQAICFGLAKMPMITHPQTLQQVPLIDFIREQDWYQTALRKFEDTVTTISGVEHSAMYLYGKTHIGNLFLSNVEVSAVTGYFDWLNNYNQSKPGTQHYKNCMTRSLKEKIPINTLLTHESDMLWNIREAVRRTQWEYFSISMPTFFRGEIARATGQFQSWWMNYFFNHSREMINQTLTGRNSLGRQLTPYGRLRAVKGLGTIQAVARTFERLTGVLMLKYLFAPVPGYLPPIPELIAGILQYFAADDDKERKKAAKRVKYGLKFWIPFSAFGRDLNKLLSGEYSIGEFLLYKKKEE